MANKVLKGISFPGLADTYTVPEAVAVETAEGCIEIQSYISDTIETEITNLDTTLTKEGMAADAAAVGERFDSLDTVVAVDENSDGNIEIRSYLPEQDYLQLDKSLTVEGAAAEGAATGIAISKSSSPHNYLDNSDFRNPVNQRGRMDNTESGYTIDRWELSEAGEANVQVQSPENGFDENRILFIVASGRADLIQRLENYAQQEGKTHTLAINVEGMVHIVTFAMGQKAGGLAIGDTGLTFYSTPSDHVLLRLDTAKRVSLYWAALYEGEYTAETLPDYKPKGYGAELAECKRYYEVYENISFPCSNNPAGNVISGYITAANMRVNPTVTMNTAYFFYGGSGVYSSVSSIIAAKSGDGLSLNCTTRDNLNANLNGIVHVGKLMLSADL